MEDAYYPHLEIQVVEHCNLNCASCTHFSPLAEPSFMDCVSFYNQLVKANRIFAGNCKSLKIMGGEPLLHPSIDQILVLARKAMPSIKLTLQTNGVLLTVMAKSFWQFCHENDILVRVTRYPVKLDEKAIENLAKRYDVDLRFHPSDGVEKSFNQYPLDLEGSGSEERNYSMCRMKRRYVLVKDGKLFSCPIAGNVEHFNHYFNTCLDCGERNYVSLDDVDSFEDFKKFAEHAIPFCKYCKSENYRRDIGWSCSQKKISEWI